MLKVYQMFCAIWYHLLNSKNVKNTGGAMSVLVKLHIYIIHGNIMYSNVNSDLSIVTIDC